MHSTHALEGFHPRGHGHGKRAVGALMLAMAAGHRGRGHGRGRGRGGPEFFNVPFGPGFPFGPGGGPFRRGPKARRGDIRTAALLLLAEQPRNGYQIMQEVEERSGGVWRPSPGSVYPALQQLEDEGLVRVVESEGQKLFELTDTGRAEVDARDEDAVPPWEEMTEGFSSEHREAASLMREVALAFTQVMRAGSKSQIADAAKVLAETRRSLYRILAEGDTPEDEA
jgi:DNA-binding PadR family transcriptional regulator